MVKDVFISSSKTTEANNINTISRAIIIKEVLKLIHKSNLAYVIKHVAIATDVIPHKDPKQGMEPLQNDLD